MYYKWVFFLDKSEFYIYEWLLCARKAQSKPREYKKKKQRENKKEPDNKKITKERELRKEGRESLVVSLQVRDQ